MIDRRNATPPADSAVTEFAGNEPLCKFNPSPDVRFGSARLIVGHVEPPSTEEKIPPSFAI